MPRWIFLLLICAGTAWGDDFIFAGYNVENYAPLVIPGQTQTGRPGKSAEAARAVVQIVQEISPDLLGVCEMGSVPQFEEFRKRLADAGLGYRDFEFVDGPDPDRHLALASRFPIIARHSLADLPCEAGNAIRRKVRRGILDVTVQVNPAFKLRILGVHLKSKRFTPEGSPDLERREEAHLLRKHIDQIQAADPTMPLLVFGDFNDTKAQPTLHEVTGLRGTPGSLTALALADREGDHWTYYWKMEDVYQRIDYLLVNRILAPLVVHAGCGIYRSPLWNVASDHRPVFAAFHPPTP
jgi:endonuclease/exonuclease/phosphatase family metal-dependent hydrolase